MRDLLEEAEDCLFTFLDETWIYPGMRHAHAWVNTAAEKSPHEFIRMGIVVRNLSFSHTLSPTLSVLHTLSPLSQIPTLSRPPPLSHNSRHSLTLMSITAAEPRSGVHERRAIDHNRRAVGVRPHSAQDLQISQDRRWYRLP